MTTILRMMLLLVVSALAFVSLFAPNEQASHQERKNDNISSASASFLTSSAAIRSRQQGTTTSAGHSYSSTNVGGQRRSFHESVSDLDLDYGYDTHAEATKERATEADDGLMEVDNNWLAASEQNSKVSYSSSVEFLMHLPSCFILSQQDVPVISLSILDSQLQSAQVEPAAFLSTLYQRLSANSNGNSNIRPPMHFIILWRRRMIESFVAAEASALLRIPNGNATNTGAAPVHVDQSRLKCYIEKTRNYLRTIRDQFEVLGLPYHIFEYGKDLSTTERKKQTQKQLRGLLHWETAKTKNTSSFATTPDSKKKRKESRKLPLRQQVSNWEEVISLGYSDTTESWEDVFKLLPKEEPTELEESERQKGEGSLISRGIMELKDLKAEKKEEMLNLHEIVEEPFN